MWCLAGVGSEAAEGKTTAMAPRDLCIEHSLSMNKVLTYVTWITEHMIEELSGPSSVKRAVPQSKSARFSQSSVDFTLHNDCLVQK